MSLVLAALAWPFAAATLPADTCEGGDRCSMSLLQTAQGARRAAGVVAPGPGGAAPAAGAALDAGVAEALENLGAVELTAEQQQALQTASRHKAGWNFFRTLENAVYPDVHFGETCSLCNPPFPERTDRKYTMRTDCGNHSLNKHPLMALVPIHKFNRKATATKPETNAWCELNAQKICADGIYNKDFLYQAKAVDYPPFMNFDPYYCLHNGWLEPEVVALQHDFEGMKKKSEEVCQDPKYAFTKWNTTMTIIDFAMVFAPANLRGIPTKRESLMAGGWTCAMGSSGCDMGYCAYSFCKLPGGRLGKYGECPGWDPVKGMPIPAAQ